MSKDLGASDEDLIKKSDEGNVSFFDNTIDESEDDNTVDPSIKAKVDKKEPETPPDDSQASQSDIDKNVFTKANKSFMEIEVKKDKIRWLYMSELGAIFGEEKHTREGFIKIFGNRVSWVTEQKDSRNFLVQHFETNYKCQKLMKCEHVWIQQPIYCFQTNFIDCRKSLKFTFCISLWQKLIAKYQSHTKHLCSFKNQYQISLHW